jgi:hypothetical protein
MKMIIQSDFKKKVIVLLSIILIFNVILLFLGVYSTLLLNENYKIITEIRFQNKDNYNEDIKSLFISQNEGQDQKTIDSLKDLNEKTNTTYKHFYNSNKF